MFGVREENLTEWNGSWCEAKEPGRDRRDQTPQLPTLVLGGTGKPGRRVAQRLAARGLPVRIGSRSGEPPFDWENEATWAPALRGVESVYVTYQPDLAVPGSVERVESFIDLAVASGVRRALGREPRDFADYARETAATGVWNVPALVGAS